jgi:hypothetical protein
MLGNLVAWWWVMKPNQEGSNESALNWNLCRLTRVLKRASITVLNAWPSK